MEIKFPCLKPKNQQCLSSKECEIYERGFCDTFCKVCYSMLKKHNFEMLDDPNIFFSHFFEKVVKSLPNLNINNNGGFYRFAERIGENVYADTLKSLRASPICFSDMFSQKDNEEGKSYDEIATDNSFLKNIDNQLLLKEILNEMENWEDECGDLILYWYHNLSKMSQKEMAEERDLKENTFNQKLKRCLKKFRKLIRRKEGI